jgi:hypothetical protein
LAENKRAAAGSDGNQGLHGLEWTSAPGNYFPAIFCRLDVSLMHPPVIYDFSGG